MADLSTLDPSKPDNSELARQGASRIRDVATAVITSFGIEHALAGVHKFLYGLPGSRPAAGNPGRLFINIGDNRVERDDGSGWDMLHAVAGYRHALATAQLITTNLSIFNTVAINVPTDGYVLALFTCTYSTPSGPDVLTIEIDVDAPGTPMDFSHTHTILTVEASLTRLLCLHAFSSAVAPGDRVIYLSAKHGTNSNGSLSNRNLSVFVL